MMTSRCHANLLYRLCVAYVILSLAEIRRWDANLYSREVDMCGFFVVVLTDR